MCLRISACLAVLVDSIFRQNGQVESRRWLTSKTILKRIVK